MSHDFRIRPGRPADAPAIAGFQQAMARETEGLELEPLTVVRGVRAVFEDPARGRYLVAVVDGRGSAQDVSVQGGCPIPPRREKARFFGAHPQSPRFAPLQGKLPCWHFSSVRSYETPERLPQDGEPEGAQGGEQDGAQGGEQGGEQDGEQLVGCLMLTPEWSDWRNATVWWIQSLYVVPGHRRRGVYRALYRRVRQEARADPGVRGVRLYVDRRNASAREAYRALGMDGEHYQLFEWMEA